MTDGRPSSEGGPEQHDGGGKPRSTFAERAFTPADFASPHPESLTRPAFLMVRHDEIVGDPYNIRDALPSIVRLARLIYKYGLLENLVVKEIGERRLADSGKRYELRAGSRRFEAIRRLIHEGIDPTPGSPEAEAGEVWRWSADTPIPVRVIGSDGHYEHLIENIERSNPHPWELGRRLNEILSAGVTTRELGDQMGRSNGWISRYAHIGRGLSPELIAVIVREHAELKLGELAAFASLRDAFGDPDGEAQVAAYNARKGRKRRRPRRRDAQGFQATLKRIQYLRADMAIPSMIRPVVSAIVEYLDNGARPNFQALEVSFMERVRTFSPHIETEDA